MGSIRKERRSRCRTPQEWGITDLIFDDDEDRLLEAARQVEALQSGFIEVHMGCMGQIGFGG